MKTGINKFWTHKKKGGLYNTVEPNSEHLLKNPKNGEWEDCVVYERSFQDPEYTSCGAADKTFVRPLANFKESFKEVKLEDYCG